MAHIFNLSPEGAELCVFPVVEGTHEIQDSVFYTQQYLGHTCCWVTLSLMYYIICRLEKIIFNLRVANIGTNIQQLFSPLLFTEEKFNPSVEKTKETTKLHERRIAHKAGAAVRPSSTTQCTDHGAWAQIGRKTDRVLVHRFQFACFIGACINMWGSQFIPASWHICVDS